MKSSIAVFLTAIALSGGSAWAAEGGAGVTISNLRGDTSPLTSDLATYTGLYGSIAAPAQSDSRVLIAHSGGGGGGGGGGGASKGTKQSASSSNTSVAQDVKPANADIAAVAAMLAQRHQQRSELYKKALEQLRVNPAAADVPDCKGAPQNAQDVCIRIDTRAKAPLKAEPSEALVTRKRVALLFGNNAYTSDQNIPSLSTPIADVQSVAEQLRKFNYEVRIVTNASKADFFHEMNKLAGETDHSDSVFIMYAGHGYQMEDSSKMGYWIPVDGKSTSPDNWISNKDISRFLRALPARQIILVSDSCFSGSLTKEQKIKQMQKLKRVDILRQRSVMALSSGGEEPVADEGSTAGHSVFAGHLLRSFNQLQDDITGFELYHGLYDAVVREFPQHPQYGAVLTAGHAGQGDYLIDVKTGVNPK